MRGFGSTRFLSDTTFRNGQQAVMAVDVASAPAFEPGTPRLLFKPPNGTFAPAQLSNIASADGQRFVVLVQLPPVQTPASTGAQR